MIPVHQTRLGNEGNCLAACFASILEIPLEAIDFSCSEAPDPGAWYYLALDRLRPHGYAYIEVLAHQKSDGTFEICVPNDTYIVVTGKTRRGEHLHSVVHRVLNKRYDFVHDPHPSGDGLSEVQSFGFLVPLAPRKHNHDGVF